MGVRLRRAAFVLLGLFATLAIGYGALLFVASARPPRPGHAFFKAPARNFAHRGGGMLAPESTLAAFEAAVAAGADVLEMDVRRTADGALVVIHDALVDRTTDGSGRVGSFDFAALSALNAGYHFQTPAGEFPYRETPVGVPTFEEVQAAHPNLRFTVEMKTPDTAEPLCAAIRAAGRELQTLVAGFDRESLTRFRAACPGVATGASFREAVTFLALAYGGLGGLYGGAVDALLVSETSGPLTVVTPRFLTAARRAGLPVIVWTVNHAEDMQRLLAFGVDGILTDDPATLAAVIAGR